MPHLLRRRRPSADPDLPQEGLRTASLRRRTFVAVLGTLAVVLLVLAVTVDLVLGARLRGDLEQRLTDRVDTAEALVGEVSTQQLVDRLAGQGVSVRLTTSDGEVVSAGPTPEQIEQTPSTESPSRPGRDGPRGAPSPPTPPDQAAEVTQIGSVLTTATRLDDGSTLQLAADASDVDRTLTQLRVVLLVASIAALLVSAALLGWVVARSLRPLDEMTAVARSITSGDRGRRLRPDRPRTELGRTAEAFDEALDAVEGAEGRARDAEHRMRGFLSDAAHELRTPLAGMSAAAETLLRSDPDREGREELAVALVREARRAGRLVDDVLLLARVDEGLTLQQEVVDVSRAAAEAAHAAQTRHPALGVSSETTTDATAWADPDRLAQVLGNVLENAARAAGPDGHVRVRSSSSDGVVSVEVTDSGPGVPVGEEERIFQRLVRLDAGRDRARGGAGLGLSIARGLARAHGGDLVVVPGGPGATFRLTLPVR
ncbi:sensor histidine kinase [Solicola sp. PLA-1-18]|uniref:sensor histidine kinase n=1 Tax=Solicola sp. PLA-1-18 TaxID=3380532 RepID=UPI003B77FCCD